MVDHFEPRDPSGKMILVRSVKSINSELHLSSTGLGRAGCLCIAVSAVVEDGPLGGL